MADLQSCYFCGTPEDVGEYAVVPPRLGGGDRSVALCPDCKTKLLDVMEPLIERAERGAGSTKSESVVDDPQSAADDPQSVDDDTGGIAMSTPDAGSGDEGETETAEPAATDSAAPRGPSNAESAASTPPQYQRAMRMLSNRPFPIPRTDVESMLANAYDLEREEIEAVISHAVDEGRLVEENGELREP